MLRVIDKLNAELMLDYLPKGKTPPYQNILQEMEQTKNEEKIVIYGFDHMCLYDDLYVKMK